MPFNSAWPQLRRFWANYNNSTFNVRGDKKYYLLNTTVKTKRCGEDFLISQAWSFCFKCLTQDICVHHESIWPYENVYCIAMCVHTLVGLPQAGGGSVDYLSCLLDVRHQQSQTFRLWIWVVCLHHTFTLILLWPGKYIQVLHSIFWLWNKNFTCFPFNFFFFLYVC